MRIFKKKAKRGFTLVELVVVIAVIAILAAVSVGAYFGITDSANNSKLEQEAKMVHTNLQLVLSANNSNHYMTRDGAYIGETTIFEDKFNEMTGGVVSYDFLYGSEPTSISKDTIYFIEPSVSTAPGSLTRYTHFGYYSNSIANKRAVVDIVSGKVDVEKTTVEVGGGGSSDTVPGHSHSYTSTVVDPTCTEDGYTLHVCECGDQYRDTYVTTPGHSYESVVTNPTCDDEGYTTYTCSSCSHSYTDNKVPATGHSYKDPEYTWAEDNSTVTARKDCNNCVHYIEETVETVPTVTQDQSCTKVELTTYTATFTKEGFTTQTKENVQTKGTSDHVYVDIVTPPTCTEDGYTTHKCTCGDEYIDSPVKAEGHNYTTEVTPPTCSSIGYTTYKCSCGDSYVADEVPAVGHEYKESVYTWGDENLTATARKDCKFCDNFVTETVNTSKSITQNQGCEADEETTYTATFTKEGFTTQTKKEITKTATGHSYSSNVTAPTCTKDGYTTHTCACGDSYVDTPVPATGHNYGEPVYDWADDYSKVDARIDCNGCDYFIEETANTEAKVTQKQTCTNVEKTTYTATFERAEFTTQTSNEIETKGAKGHSYTTQVTAPTCTENGYTTYSCSCGHSYVDDETSATGHSWDNGICSICFENCTHDYGSDYECDICGYEMLIYLKPNSNWTTANARFVAYFFNETRSAWSDMTDANADGIYEVKVINGFPNVVFCRMNPVYNENKWNDEAVKDRVWDQTNDLSVPTNNSEATCYELAKASWSKGDGRWINKDDSCQHSFSTSEENCLYCDFRWSIYLKPNSNWTTDNARFAAYFYGNGTTWADMTDKDKDGVYECSVPKGYTSVIFCRMNPGALKNDWDNKWNQTSDLEIPLDGQLCYTMKNGTWDKGGGTWSKI